MRQDDVLIKWTGSKRLQAPEIIKHFPDRIKTYHEPFIGGGSMLYVLLCSDISVEEYSCSDISDELIGLWESIKCNPNELFDFYCEHWPFDKDKYYALRSMFNEDRDPIKFFCLLRTCRNGLVRFNTKNDFNSGFHERRRGIRPSKLKPIIDDWHQKLKENNVQFKMSDYKEITTQPGDLMYLDPPYPSENRFYYGDFEFNQFWGWLGGRQSSWLMSWSDKEKIAVPSHLYENQMVIPNSTNKYDQLNDRQVLSEDSLYIHTDVEPTEVIDEVSDRETG